MIPDSADSADDVVVPDELAAALRRAADAVPAADLHPRGPRLRYAARRRRKRTVAACLTSAAVLVVAVLISPAANRPSGPSDIAVASRSTTTDGGDALTGPHDPVLLPMAHAELLPDGSTRPLPLAEPDDVLTGDAVLLPDGRLVTLATRDLRGEDVAAVLAVFDRDRQLSGEHDIGGSDGQVSIAGVHDDQVVLVRSTTDGKRVSTIDPDTFEESQVAEVDRLPGVASAAGDRLVAVDDSTTGDAGSNVPACPVTVVDLASGDSGEVVTLPCIGLHAVAVSPDGSRAAVVIERRAGITATGNAIAREQDILDQAVVFVSLDDGEVLGSERFDIAPGCPTSGGRDCPRPHGPVEYRGMAWVGDDRVELVVQDPDPDADPRAIEVGELVPGRLRVIPVEVGSG